MVKKGDRVMVRCPKGPWKLDTVSDIEFETDDGFQRIQCGTGFKSMFYDNNDVDDPDNYSFHPNPDPPPTTFPDTQSAQEREP